MRLIVTATISSACLAWAMDAMPSLSAPQVHIIPLKRHVPSNSTISTAAERRWMQQQRIRRRINEVDATVGPLVYNEAPLRVGYGTHYAELYLGLPPQSASVIIDTGSHLTALPCSSCDGCGTHTDPFFDMTKSTTARYLTCHQYTSCRTCQQDKCYISQSYTEGSMWEAIVIDDLAWVGGFEGKDMDMIMKHFGFRFPVGCQTRETGLFITQKENGIMGLGRDEATVMAHMRRNNRIEHDVFSLCFGDDGGSLVLGGIDHSHHTTTIAYTPLINNNSGWYPVRVKKILVGNQAVDASESQWNTGKGVIVDSGTTDTFFVSSTASSFKSLFKSQSGGITYDDDAMDVEIDDFSQLPAITIVLEGMPGQEDVELTIGPQKYLSLNDDGKYFGNFHFTERAGGVLGASTMIGYDVIFDVESMRVGFAESPCGGAMKSNGATLVTEKPTPTPPVTEAPPTSTPPVTEAPTIPTPVATAPPSTSVASTPETPPSPASSATEAASTPAPSTTEEVSVTPSTSAPIPPTVIPSSTPIPTSLSQSNTTSITNAPSSSLSADTGNGTLAAATKSNASKQSFAGRFYIEIVGIFAIGIAAVVAMVWRRRRQRAWIPVGLDSTRGGARGPRRTRNGRSVLSDHDAALDDDEEDGDGLYGDDGAAVDDELPRRALSPPRRDAASTTAASSAGSVNRVPSPRFTIGSDDETTPH